MNSKSFETIIKTYRNIVDEVVYETLEREKELTTTLIVLLSNWIDLSDSIKEYRKELDHILSGILFAYVWREYGWIIYEILSGQYFGALRNLRFIFEGAFLSLHYDHFIDEKIYEKHKGYGGEIGLKTEIIELVESLKNVGKDLSSQDQNKVKQAQRSIRKKVKDLIEKSNLSNNKKKWYFGLYIDILIQPELYWGVSKIIREFCKAFKIDEKLKNHLVSIWDELSGYTHFSSKFLDEIRRKPDLLLENQYDKELFKKCVDFVFVTFDVLCAILVIRFEKIRDQVKKIVKWWDENSNRKFELTKAVLEIL